MGDDAGLLRIGEFAGRSTLTVQQLRRYHALGLLLPAVIDQETGYRYYHEEQAATADLIALLRSVDTPLSDIRHVLGNPHPTVIDDVLARQRMRLERNLAEATSRLLRLDTVRQEVRHMGAASEPHMVEVRVEGVIANFRRESTWSVLAGSEGPPDWDAQVLNVIPMSAEPIHRVILAETSGERILSIWIGMAEANGVAMALNNLQTSRPLTYDLFVATLARLGLRVQRAEVTRLTDAVFYADIHAGDGDRVEILDARPSDAINVALRAGAPITVEEGLLQERPAVDEPVVDQSTVELIDEGSAEIVAALRIPRGPVSGQLIRVVGRSLPQTGWACVPPRCEAEQGAVTAEPEAEAVWQVVAPPDPPAGGPTGPRRAVVRRVAVDEQASR